MTLEQLGKFVAITLRWPLLLEDLDRAPTLLTRLQELALDSEALRFLLQEPLDSERFNELTSRFLRRWAEQPDLVRLLRAGCLNEQSEVEPEGERIYSLSNLDVEKLLQVSPRTRPTPPVDEIFIQGGSDTGAADSMTQWEAAEPASTYPIELERLRAIESEITANREYQERLEDFLIDTPHEEEPLVEEQREALSLLISETNKLKKKREDILARLNARRE